MSGGAAASHGGRRERATTSRGRPPALKRYGQNHLVDAGTLEVIVRMAAVRDDDVVLEVGPADGALTARLVGRARALHAYEIDRRFAPALARLAEEHQSLQVHLGDALRAPLAELDPPPTALVANLAYNIAIPLIMQTIAGVPSIERWAVMVQKELADRLFAAPRTKPYSAVSVLVQLGCEERARRAIGRQVFSPPPRVDSAFVVFERRQGWPGERWPALEALVRLAFGQRRKQLVNSLTGTARGGRAPLARDRVRAALDELGVPPTARPEELAPPQWIELADALEWT